MKIFENFTGVHKARRVSRASPGHRADPEKRVRTGSPARQGSRATRVSCAQVARRNSRNLLRVAGWPGSPGPAGKPGVIGPEGIQGIPGKMGRGFKKNLRGFQRFSEAYAQKISINAQLKIWVIF